MATINIALLGRGVVTGQAGLPRHPAAGPRRPGDGRLDPLLRAEVGDGGGRRHLPHPRPAGRPDHPDPARISTTRKVYATVGIERPGATVDVYLEIQRQQPNTGEGTVRGKVLRQSSGQPAVPAAGARITVYADGHPIDSMETRDDGSYAFAHVPAGRVSLQAADWRVSRASAVVDLLLADGETRYQDLKLVDGGTRTLVGQVLFRDPITNTLQPVEGAVAFVKGPGNFAYSDAGGTYRIEGVPVQSVEEHLRGHGDRFPAAVRRPRGPAADHSRPARK